MFGVGFVTPFQTHANPDDLRRAGAAESSGDRAAAAALEHEAGHEQALGRGSMGDLIDSGKSIGESLGDGTGAALGGMSSATNVGGAYKESGVHSGKPRF